MIVNTSCVGCGVQIELKEASQQSPAIVPVCAECPEPGSRVNQLLQQLRRALHEDEGARARALTDQIIRDLDRADRAAPYSLEAAAVAYASIGWRVFPLGTGRKTPAIPRDRGGKGVLDANNDVDRIKRWWSKHPTHNIGLATGFSFDVVDVDFDKPNAAEAWGAIKEVDTFEVDAMATTPHGLHAFVLPTGDKNTSNRLAGIDYRGENGYVVAPPSVAECDKGHDSDAACADGRYKWWFKPSPRLMLGKVTQK